MKKKYVTTREFAGQLSEETGFTKKDILFVLDKIPEITLNNLLEGKSTKICKDIGVTFSDLDARDRISPSGVPIHIKARRNPRGMFSAKFKEALFKED